jgi:hypothetical protein
MASRCRHIEVPFSLTSERAKHPLGLSLQRPLTKGVPSAPGAAVTGDWREIPQRSVGDKPLGNNERHAADRGIRPKLSRPRNQYHERYRGCSTTSILGIVTMPTQLSPLTLKGAPAAPRAWAAHLPGKPSASLLNRFGKPFLAQSLEVISIGDTGVGLVAIQWTLHGTHTGPLTDGTPPTGHKVSYPGGFLHSG